MFTLNVAFGPIAWVLGFHTKESAEKAVAALNVYAVPNTAEFRVAGQQITVTDDFGQTVSCKEAPTAILFEDLDQSKLLHIEVTLHRARVQQDVQKRAESDATLRRSSPAIMSPFPGGMRPNGMGN